MNEIDDPTLLAVAEAVTDGMRVDWANLKARNPALAIDLTAMEAAAQVIFAYGAVRDGLESQKT